MNEILREEEILGKAYDARLMRRLIIYLKPYRWLVLLSVLLLLISSIAGLAGPYLTKIAIDKYIATHDLTGLRNVVTLFLVAIIVAFGVQYAQVYLMQYVGQKAMRDIRMQIFAHVQHLDLAFFDKNPVGRILTRITSDVQALHELFTSGLVAVFGDLFALIGIVVVMLALNWQLALVVFSVLPLLVLATAVFRRKVRQAYRDVRTNTARINAYTQEHISGISVIQSFASEEKAFSDFNRINADLMTANLRNVFYYAIFFPVVELIGAISIALIIGYGGIHILAGSLTVGSLVAFIQYADRFYQPIRDLSEKYNILQSAMAAAERIFKLLDTRSSIKNPKVSRLRPPISGSIEFRRLSFAYENGFPVLQEIDLKVAAGEKIAIVGATGSGKTTLASLLCRFYDYTDGDILLDGVSLKEIPEREVRRHIALVLQDVFLFSGDIYRNIRLNSENIPLARVREVAQQIGAETFINRLPGRYQYQLLERGQNLSLGQRQLLAFARALVFDPIILVLDEATSSVDTETELLLQKALKKLLDGRTALIIAHRLSTVKIADRIVVMHKGRIREVGTHEELLARQGIYYRLYKLQYRDQELTATHV